jgi:membrane protease YdiL (CAAX protease family)
MGLSQGLSLLVAAIYLVVCLLDPHRSIIARLGTLLLIAAALCFPLACIWFGDELGNYVGMLPGPAINKRSPGWLVKLGGWLLLLLPVVVAWVFYRS